MWLANALLLALGKRKDFTYTRSSRDRGDAKAPHRAGAAAK
jgi:hypothetical protein